MSERHYNRPMLFLRSLIFWIFQIINTLIFGLPVMIGGLINPSLGYAFARRWAILNLHALRIVCGVKWQVDGEEHVPKEASIVLSKHQSTWETYFLAKTLPDAVFVAKRSLTLIPIFGWALVTVRCVLIDRKAGRSAIKQLVEQGGDRLRRGRWVFIFPEGTRRPVGAEPKYRIGGAVLAEQTGAQVVPMAVNSGEFWPRMSFIKWPGTITVSFGPVIDSTGKKAEQILAETEAWIEGRMAEITVLNRFPY